MHDLSTHKANAKCGPIDWSRIDFAIGSEALLEPDGLDQLEWLSFTKCDIEAKQTNAIR